LGIETTAKSLTLIFSCRLRIFWNNPVVFLLINVFFHIVSLVTYPIFDLYLSNRILMAGELGGTTAGFY